MKQAILLLVFIVTSNSCICQNPDSLTVIKTVDSLMLVSDYLSSQFKFEKALDMTAEAETLVLGTIGSESAAYGKVCLNLGQIMFDQGNYLQAEQLFLKAKTLLANTLGKEHADYAISLRSLADLYAYLAEFDKAEQLYLEAMKIRSAVASDKDQADYAESVNNLANLYANQGDFDKAEKLYLESMSIREKVFGKQHQKYAESLDNLATLYDEMGDFDKAEEYYQEACDLMAKSRGKNHPDYAITLFELADFYLFTSEHDKAEKLYLKIVEIREKTFGRNHPEVAQALNNLANLYADKGDFDKAEKLYLESMSIREKVLGKQHPLYAQSLENLAILYSDKNDYNAAEPLYLEAHDIWGKALGKNHPDYAYSAHNLAVFYGEKAENEKAENLYLEAIDIQARVLGKDSYSYAFSLVNLAKVYLSKGEYGKAEKLYLEAKDIQAKNVGENHLEYSFIANSLASLYMDIGDYEKAEKFYLQAKAIRAEKLGEEHLYYATVLDNLASLYVKTGKNTQAEALYLEALKITEKAVGKDHSDYAMSLSNLANFYSKRGNYDKAYNMHLEAQKIRIKILGKNHPTNALSLYDIGNLFMEKSEYDKAEKMLLQAWQIQAAKLGKESPAYTNTLSSLAALYQKSNRIKEATLIFLELSKLNRLQIEKAATYSSENQMIAFMRKFEYDIASFQSFAQINPSVTLNQESYNINLLFNGLVLENERLLARAIAGADSITHEIYAKWQGCHRRLAKRYARPIADNKRITEVEIEAEGYEKMLIRNLPDFQKARRIPNWQDIRDRLKPGEVALEFIRYRFINSKAQETDSVLYAALLLKSDWNGPQFVPLFEERSLDSLLRLSGQRKADYVAHLYAQEERGVIAQDKPSKTLYELVWQPIDSTLKDASNVYFAPTGLLHRINIGAISINFDSTLADKYHLIELGSTRQLLDQKSRAFIDNNAVLFGGIQYEMDSSAIFATNANLDNLDLASRGQEEPLTADSSEQIARQTIKSARGGNWNYLKWTEKEVESIAPILEAAGIDTYVRKGFEATEEAFKVLGSHGPSPKVIHLATHGFFFPDPREDASIELDEEETGFKTSHNPLVRSGLLMAGSNHTWESGKPFKKGMDNGILTAYEISHLDLSNTELVVLSACETGLGDIEGSEGVYGLQRAFKIAGVKYLIMSLWQVPDFQTKELMTTFYSKWLTDNMSIPAAFRSAQQELREKYQNPYFWAGFVLVE
ncbi:MAG: CHAT domain-containing protein [Lewinellaceae bacterium]|nr:CHAT domain-containing protein [Lewinellaceae bacterium]